MKSLIVVCSIAAIFAGSLFGQNSGLAPLPPDGFVTLQQIVSDFSTNPDAALQKYNGMRIVVYGRVGDVGESNDGSGDPLAVYMQLPNQTTPDVKALFGADDIPTSKLVVANDGTKATVFHRTRQGKVTPEYSFIVEGQNVGIIGSFDNFVAGDIVLKNCGKLAPAEMNKILREHKIPTW